MKFVRRYDHLTNILTKVLEERPFHPGDFVEEISRAEKQKAFTLREDNIINKVDRTTEVALAEIQRRLFSVSHKGCLI